MFHQTEEQKINQLADYCWAWCNNVIGDGNCPIVDSNTYFTQHVCSYDAKCHSKLEKWVEALQHLRLRRAVRKINIDYEYCVYLAAWCRGNLNRPEEQCPGEMFYGKCPFEPLKCSEINAQLWLNFFGLPQEDD